MFKALIMFIFMTVLLRSEIAFARMQTVEKWQCSKKEVHGQVRIYASGKAEVPCKVFVAEDCGTGDDNWALEEAQNSGRKKPFFLSVNSYKFCKKKLDNFLTKKRKNGWRCQKL